MVLFICVESAIKPSLLIALHFFMINIVQIDFLLETLLKIKPILVETLQVSKTMDHVIHFLKVFKSQFIFLTFLLCIMNILCKFNVDSFCIHEMTAFLV